jgi:hypothetical protein
LTLAAVLGAAIWLPTSAHAAFGFGDFGVSFSAKDGSAETQAGSHPFAFTTSFEANTDGEDTDGRMRELLLDLPPGLLLDPGAAPRCAEADFLSDACPLATVVGLATIEVEEAGLFEDTRIYALMPDEGELLRLGFDVAGVDDVLVDVFLASQPPHNAVAVLGEWPEAFDVFGAELDLWGVPADPAHDVARGGPVAGPQIPLLTLPTRCDGALTTYFEAGSWGGASDEGDADTLGLTGCGSLAFAPSVAIAPTTGAALSPTGLELSADFDDEGLTNPAGLAQSQLRDLVFVLPGGMEIDPSAAGGLGVCTEAELEEEAPEGLPGAGCPASSAIGSLELESPLLAGDVLDGDLYLGTPLTELAKSGALELYAVARSAARGIVVKQVVEVEPDPETGQLVAYAEDLPQLPFSRLDLTLFVGNSPLLTPPRCDDYEIEAELSPWAGNGDYLLASEFSLDTGPGGGPCPSDEITLSDDGPPPHALPAPAVAIPPARRAVRRCAKGKRPIRRKGVRRCVRRCRKGKRVVRRKSKLRCVSTKRKKHRKHRRR